MSLNITFLKIANETSDSAVFLINKGSDFTPMAQEFDEYLGGLLSHSIASSSKFSGKNGETLIIPLPAGKSFKRVILLGIGAPEDYSAARAENAGGKLVPALRATGAQNIALFAGDFKYAAHMVMGIKMRAYSFEHYKKPAEDATPLRQIDIISDACEAIETNYQRLHAIISGIYFARDLVNEPPNNLYPESYAHIIRDQLKPLGVDVEILDDKKLEKMKMGGIMAVGKGSDHKPRMVIMRWNGAEDKNAAPLALVGKGVTFDTGGISIKPAASMDEMKMDMGGSAAVVGTIKALAARNAKANVIGIVGLAENMPASNAYRPGDIITTYAGKTVEILNTDAEGRLVLADCLTYIQEITKPAGIIDLATLTGAMMVALGHEYCGTFVNDNEFWSKIEQAGGDANEKLWRMPLDEVWKKDMISDIADLRNLGKTGRYGGACTAAGFLEHFINDGTPWAHMDIAGTAWKKTDGTLTPKFATGFGVRTLEQLVYNAYEGQ